MTRPLLLALLVLGYQPSPEPQDSAEYRTFRHGPNWTEKTRVSLSDSASIDRKDRFTTWRTDCVTTYMSGRLMVTVEYMGVHGLHRLNGPAMLRMDFGDGTLLQAWHVNGVQTGGTGWKEVGEEELRRLVLEMGVEL